MTPRQLAVIERARHTPARFVQIPPKRGVRVGDAMRKLREEDARRMSAVLEAEFAALADLVKCPVLLSPSFLRFSFYPLTQIRLNQTAERN